MSQNLANPTFSVDSVDPDQEYPLNDTWVLSFKGKTAYKKQQSENDWLSSYKHIFSIKTIKMFWQLFNNIHPWTDLHVGSIYAVFKDGIRPSWEDPKNIKGCSYVLYLNRNRLDKESMDELFLNVLMFLVGNETNYHEFINGVSFERKYRGDKITLWCSAQSEEMLKVIMEKLDIRKTDYTRSVAPSNDNYKIVVKMIDHQEELRKVAAAEHSHTKYNTQNGDNTHNTHKGNGDRGNNGNRDRGGRGGGRESRGNRNNNRKNRY